MPRTLKRKDYEACERLEILQITACAALERLRILALTAFIALEKPQILYSITVGVLERLRILQIFRASTEGLPTRLNMTS